MTYISYFLSWMKTLMERTKSNTSIGGKSIIFYKTKIIIASSCDGKVIIGDNVRLGCSDKRYHVGMPFPTKLLLDGKKSIIKIGNNSRLWGTYCHASKSITIGKNCVIAAGVNIMDSNGHKTISANRTIGRDTPQEVIIGDNVWIGVNSIILKGTFIGNNCIVAAGSVVKGHFQDNQIIQGNPAMAVKTISI